MTIYFSACDEIVETDVEFFEKQLQLFKRQLHERRMDNWLMELNLYVIDNRMFDQNLTARRLSETMKKELSLLTEGFLYEL